MNILSISHYDLDGFGCQLCIDAKFKNANIEYANCGYGGIQNTLKSYNFNDYDLIFVTDLNVIDKDLEVFEKKILDTNKKIIYIDHHLYDDKTLEKYNTINNKNKNFKFIVDQSMSATMKTYEVLKLDIPRLEKLVYIIDTFDTWRSERKEFTFSKYFNEWFWFNNDTFFSKMKNANYDFKIYLDEIKKLKNEIEYYYKNNPEKMFTYDSEYKIFVSLQYKYSSLLENFYNYAVAFFVNTKDGNSGRISIRDKVNIRDEIQEYCKEKNLPFGGHESAYGIVVENNIKKILDELIKVAKEALEAPF